MLRSRFLAYFQIILREVFNGIDSNTNILQSLINLVKAMTNNAAQDIDL